MIRLTDDGITVPENYTLKMSFIHERVDDRSSLDFHVGWQQEGRARLPYLVINIGLHRFQIGWLWAQQHSPSTAKPIPSNLSEMQGCLYTYIADNKYCGKAVSNPTSDLCEEHIRILGYKGSWDTNE